MLFQKMTLPLSGTKVFQPLSYGYSPNNEEKLMELCLGVIHDKPVMLEWKDGHIYIDGEIQPVKNITEQDVSKVAEEIQALPKSNEDGYKALVNAIRASFLVKLIENAVGDECIDRLSHLLDHVHYDVLQYLGEVPENNKSE